MRELFIGLISGTSLDGVDAAILAYNPDQSIELLAHATRPYPGKLLNSLRPLCNNEQIAMDELGRMDRQLGDLFADAVTQLLKQENLESSDIVAIGSHGQTIRHQPLGEHPYTLQIGDPNRIAEQTGITTIADFRRRDMAAGGEGAPMVPAFHRAIFSSSTENRVVVNIGGIANITCLPREPGSPVTGFDCGPGNTLMDGVYREHFQGAYDQNGAIAASGTIIQPLLTEMLRESYFQLPPPKSTGPELFSKSWLNSKMDTLDVHPSPQDQLATLCELTALSISDAIVNFGIPPERVLVCGGGAHNRQLMQRLAQHVNCPVEDTSSFGVGPDWVEAAAFAWLARQTLKHQPGNVPDVTGASKAVILGGIYPA